MTNSRERHRLSDEGCVAVSKDSRALQCGFSPFGRPDQNKTVHDSSHEPKLLGFIVDHTFLE
ncbi:unnamed protein product [Musa acuminata subsp. burmannicoides]